MGKFSHLLIALFVVNEGVPAGSVAYLECTPNQITANNLSDNMSEQFDGSCSTPPPKDSTMIPWIRGLCEKFTFSLSDLETDGKNYEYNKMITKDKFGWDVTHRATINRLNGNFGYNINYKSTVDTSKLHLNFVTIGHCIRKQTTPI